eukprot:Nk52_evm21s2377 gene=Nk52_evmTU21s2377
MRTSLVFIAALVSMLLAFTLASPMTQEESERHIVSNSHAIPKPTKPMKPNPQYHFTAVLKDSNMRRLESCTSPWTSVNMEHTSKYLYKPVLHNCKFASKVDISVELDKKSFDLTAVISVDGKTEKYSIKMEAVSGYLKKTAMEQYNAFANTEFLQSHFRYFSYMGIDWTHSHDYNLFFSLDFDFAYGTNEAKN